MRAEKVIRSLLMASSGVTALVEDRCRPPPLPQNTELPALTVEHISTVELPTISAGGTALVQSRIEINALANDYATVKALIEVVRQACLYQRGTIAGIEVASVLRGSAGPDLRDDDVGLYRQSIDFLVVYREA